VMDLALADLLLAEGLAGEVWLHVKPQPFYVSDVMARDVVDAVEALPAGGEAAGALSQRLQGYLREGRLQVVDHWLYATSLFFFQLSEDLRHRLGAMDLVFVKGDANYRRLVGDVHWAPDTPFGQVTATFRRPWRRCAPSSPRWSWACSLGRRRAWTPKILTGESTAGVG